MKCSKDETILTHITSSNESSDFYCHCQYIRYQLLFIKMIHVGVITELTLRKSTYCRVQHSS